MKINSRFAKAAVASGLVVATGAAVLGLTGFASAQVARQSAAVVSVVDDTTTGATSNAADAPAEGTVNAESATTDGATGSSGTSAVTGESHARPKVLAAAAEALGLTEAELMAELQSGKSIKQIADAKSVSIDTVIAKMTAAVKTHLDAEVASGEHTQAEADAKLAEFQTRVTEMVNKTGLPQRGGKGGHGPAKFATANLAKVLTLTEAELQTELRSGKTIKQIADAKSVSIDDVKAVLSADFKAHLAEEVASGKHTQAEADAKLAEFTTRLDDMVNGVRPARGPGGKGGHGGRHGHGPMGDAPVGQPGAAPAQGTSTNA